MSYRENGSLTTDKRTVDESTSWDSTGDWEEYQSINGVIIENGTILLEEVSIPDSGVARYTFDDSDTDGNDSTDVWNGNTASINNADTGVTGANQTYTTNEAYAFNGSGDNVETPITDDLTEFSFACWVNSDKEYVSSQGEAISTRSDVSGGALRGRGGEWSFYAHDGDGFINITAVQITTDQWYHLVGVVDSSELRLYVDGTLEESASFGSYNNGDGIRIGERWDGGSEFNGKIDDVRIYDKALSDTEVDDLYNDGSIL